MLTASELTAALDAFLIKFFVIVLSAYIVHWFIIRISYRGDR